MPFRPRFTPYIKEFSAPAGASADAAAAAAMYTVLSTIVPAQKTAFEAAYQSIVNKIPQGEARERGTSFGNEVAKVYLEARSQDGNRRIQAASGHGPMATNAPIKCAHGCTAIGRCPAIYHQRF